MKVAVIGYGQFATTVANALRLCGETVSQYDVDPPLVRPGQMEREPTPLDPIRGCVSDVFAADVVWFAYDTPLDVTGRGAVQPVQARIRSFCHTIRAGATVICSSQWPVGTTAMIAADFPDLRFVYVVENIRVGHALEDFRHQRRAIVGAPGPWSEPVADLLRPFTERIEWMSLASAEMAKHALNAFLALQIAFINEIDTLAAQFGADGRDVGRALVGDARISPRAYLTPGAPFGGGSLQRDVLTLNDLAKYANIETPVLSAIIPSNNGHRTQPA